MKLTGVRMAVELYASIGFRPLPMWGVDGEGRCRCGSSECRPGKHAPDWVEESWKEGRVYGPDDFTELDNIALALGPWGGSDDWLVVFDVDGEAPMSALFDLPPTLEQRSPRGRHLFFVVPAYSPLGNWTDVFTTKHDEGWALDLRYARGRINVAPSRSAFGTYEWLEMREPAELPQAAIDRILDRRVERGLPVQWEWDRGAKRP